MISSKLNVFTLCGLLYGVGYKGAGSTGITKSAVRDSP